MPMRLTPALRSTVAALLAAVFMSLLASCGGGGASEQNKPALVQVTGTATDGTTLSASAIVKGTAGLFRTSTAVAGSQTYAVSLDQLRGPYMVQAGSDYTVAPGPGIANSTPLTTLLADNLFGQDAAAVFTSYGPLTPQLSARVTDANIATAQTATVAFLQSTVGVPVPAGIGSFIATPFNPVAGDPMFDLIVALQARIAVLGPTAYGAMVAAFINHAHLCVLESVNIVIGGTSAAFCPATKTAQPDGADSTVTDYGFTTDSGDTLTVSARDATVLGAIYATVSGAPYACSGPACSTIAVSAPASDQTRSIVFTNTSLTRSGGAVNVSGTLTTALAGVVLPVLPCSDNRFFLIREDNSVVADCVNVSDGTGLLGLPGTFGSQQGTTPSSVYWFRNSDGSNGLPNPAEPTQVYVTINGNAIESVDVVHPVTDTNTGVTTLDFDYKCRGAGCQGVTVSPPTINTDFGFNLEIRTFTLNNTVLSAVQADGSLSSTVSATIKATFNGFLISNADQGTFFPPPANACDAFTNKVLTAPTDESFVFPSCAELNGGSYSTTVLANGDLSLLVSTFGNGDVTVVTNSTGTVVKSATVGIPTEPFGCAGDCTGITVSAPDGAGNRTVTLVNQVLHIIEGDGFPTGSRTATANGVFVVPPP